ncbi:MAG: hypothetical protein JSW05_02740 [Candidatus Thorarchaeota archaeon]|nr:MAG: hypothetical protein JSW05_02740 [Candidatus Thorarchaeota archaeon]
MAKRRRIGFILLVLTVAIVGPSTELIHPPTKTDGSTQYIETSAEELDHTAIREEERPAQEKSYLNHSPISITSDADFAAQKAAEGWAGNGTQTNPYVIEGYNITHSVVILEVANVSSFLIIRD